MRSYSSSMAAPVPNLTQHTATQCPVEKEKNTFKVYHLTSHTDFRNSGAATAEAGGGRRSQSQAAWTEKSLVQGCLP